MSLVLSQAQNYFNDIISFQAPFGSKIVLQFEGEFDIYCLDNTCYHWVEVRSGADLSETGPRFMSYK